MSFWKIVPGAALTAIEREWLKNAACSVAEKFEAPLLLNIGIFKGASMHCLRAGAPAARLVGIDSGVQCKSGDIQEKAVLRAELIWKDSQQIAWNRPIHLLFVDGGHAYKVVHSDIRTFGKHVVVGGIMAFHDYALSRECPEARRRRLLGVRRAIDELCTRKQGWGVCGSADSIKAFQRVGE